MSRHADRWSRREFLGGLGAAGLVGSRSGTAAAEPPPETTRLRLYNLASLCLAPQYVAEDLLRAEGFTDVTYPDYPRAVGVIDQHLAVGEVDVIQWFVAPLVLAVDKGAPIVALSGVHVGCFGLFGTERVRAIRDLKGKTIAVPWVGAGPHTFVATMLAYVGLDPRKDVTFVEHPADEAIRLLEAGKIDALIGFPPVPQILRAKKIGHVVVESAVDRPWSQYFCCVVVANKEFVRKHPVATKRAVRAILKADQVCALEPERAARALVDRGYTKSYEYALQTMKDVPYGRWRQYEPEDAIRFYALRLHEVGMVKSSPQKIIAQGTDWRFLNELKKELKG